MLFKSENAVFKFSGVEWREPKTGAKKRFVYNPHRNEREQTLFAQDINIRQFNKNTKATATRMLLNKRFNEQHNRCARAF